MSATIERPAGDAMVASPPDQGGLTPETLATLESIERRLLWLSTQIIHHANNVRPNPDKSKVGGHQASSASVVDHPHRALLLTSCAPGDRVSIKPHASPVFHAAQYLLGRLDRSYLTTLREFGGLQAYPSAHQGPGSGRFLDRLGRVGRGGAGLRRAGRQVRQDATSATSPPTASSPSSAMPSWTRGTSGKRSPRRRSRGWATSSGSSTSTGRVSTGSSPACARRG